MAAPLPLLPVKRAATDDDAGTGASPDDQQGPGGGAAGAEARRAVKAVLFLAAVALPCLVLYHAVAPPADVLLRPGVVAAAVPWWLGDPRGDVELEHEQDSEDARLERVLRAAAMPNDTVILTTLNSAWSEPGSVLDVFLESFRTGESTRALLDHLVIVSLDTTAHARCRRIHRHCFALVTGGVDFSGQKNFMTDGYLKMMWRRIDFLRQVLEKGFSFVFTDTDIVWFRNPVPHFYPDGDFQIACDHFTGDPDDLSNAPNGGFAYVLVRGEERHPGLHDQDVLNAIKRDPYVAELGVRIKFLSTDLFGGLCEPSRNMSRVCTMHANCCIGLRRKISDLNAMLQDWRRFVALPRDEKHSAFWTVPRNCR
ncbi:hypothetical protein U9M48_005989 [Paspalum notatum var. saurae]|uniref:Nucleotide-diphospho-sugar transferase domain-containing protein n=1 Tax=Paspalum notatum var. saurae TaxID=547442 RepID=A0AAQ3PS42_PASNO